MSSSSQGKSQSALGQQGRFVGHAQEEGTAVSTLFNCLKQTLKKSHTQLNELSGFVYDQGPGSTLGIRVAEMALRTFRQILAPQHLAILSFQTLPLACLLIDPPAGHLISEATLGHWNIFTQPEGKLAIIPQSRIAELSRPIWHLQQRQSSHKAPHNAQTLSLAFNFPPQKAKTLLTEHPLKNNAPAPR